MHLIKISNEYQIHMTTYNKTSPMSSGTNVTTQFMFIIKGVIICIKDLNI